MVSHAFFSLHRTRLSLAESLLSQSSCDLHESLRIPEDCRNADSWFAYMPAEYLVRRVCVGRLQKNELLSPIQWHFILCELFRKSI